MVRIGLAQSPAGQQGDYSSARRIDEPEPIIQQEFQVSRLARHELNRVDLRPSTPASVAIATPLALAALDAPGRVAVYLAAINPRSAVPPVRWSRPPVVILAPFVILLSSLCS